MRMLVTVEFADAGISNGSRRVTMIYRDPELAEAGDIGLTLAEGKHLLQNIQHEFVTAQAEEIVAAARTCTRCGRRLAMKDVELRHVHTLFGRCALSATRWISCRCDGSPAKAFSPLKGWLVRSSNELRYQAARWGSMHSYQEAATILKELLPVDWRFGKVRIREAVLQVGEQIESETDLPVIPECCSFDADDTQISMAFDGGYARKVRKGSPRNFEILTGTIQKHRKIKVFATAYASRRTLPDRLKRFVSSAGVPVDSPINVVTDGAASLLRLQSMLPMKTRFVLDYFHVAMKLRHISQCVLHIPPCQLSDHGSIFELHDRFNFLRAYVWSGRQDKVEESINTMLNLLDQVPVISPDDADAAKMAAGHVCDLWGYLRVNAAGVINYQDWKQRGERISSSSVEGTVSHLIGRRLCKSQHMCWTKRGAHLLLQVRCALLNNELLTLFCRWHSEINTLRAGATWNWLPQHS